MKNGDLVIVPTTQAGTVINLGNGEAWVLLANGDLWTGPERQARPATKEECEAAPKDVERFKDRPKVAITRQSP